MYSFTHWNRKLCLRPELTASVMRAYVGHLRDRPLPVWGWAEPGEDVTVTLRAERATVTAGPDGRWLVRLAAQPMATEPAVLTVAGRTNTIVARDVLLGDVWLAGGQSNMEFTLGICNAADDVAAADLPLVREFDVVTVQRKLKDAGRFVFIDREKGNPSFLPFVEPTIHKARASLARLGEDPDMRSLAAVLDDVLGPRSSAAPSAAP